MSIIIALLILGLIASLIRNSFYWNEVDRLKKENEKLKIIYGDCKDDSFLP
jgi:hypothetical protein